MISLDSLTMRVGLGQFRELSQERLQFIKQCGVDDFQLNTPDLPGQDRWEFDDFGEPRPAGPAIRSALNGIGECTQHLLGTRSC